MGNRFKNFGYKFQTWMQGRYGNDEFSRTLFIASIALLILYMIFRLPALSFVAIGILAFTLFRTYSRNISQRQKERYAFLKFVYFFRARYNYLCQRAKDRKQYAYFKCKKCRKILRVPKGKGKIKIKCPECGYEMIRKT